MRDAIAYGPDELVSVCSYCGVVYGRKSAQGAPPGLSHGVCRPCRAVVVEPQLAAIRARHRAAAV